MTPPLSFLPPTAAAAAVDDYGATTLATPGTPRGVHEVVAQLEGLAQRLQEEHGLACAILGKNDRVVTFARPRKYV